MKLSSRGNLGQQHQHEVLGAFLRNEGLGIKFSNHLKLIWPGIRFKLSLIFHDFYLFYSPNREPRQSLTL